MIKEKTDPVLVCLLEMVEMLERAEAALVRKEAERKQLARRKRLRLVR